MVKAFGVVADIPLFGNVLLDIVAYPRIIIVRRNDRKRAEAERPVLYTEQRRSALRVYLIPVFVQIQYEIEFDARH